MLKNKLDDVILLEGIVYSDIGSVDSSVSVSPLFSREYPDNWTSSSISESSMSPSVSTLKSSSEVEGQFNFSCPSFSYIITILVQN